MRFLAAVLFLPAILGERLVIPEIQSAVSAQLAEFSAYTPDYAAATVGDAPSVSPSSEKRQIEERQTGGSYWYETIAHQGISAFNANRATYKVYRNVKDYGAKGYGQFACS